MNDNFCDSLLTETTIGSYFIKNNYMKYTGVVCENRNTMIRYKKKSIEILKVTEILNYKSKYKKSK